MADLHEAMYQFLQLHNDRASHDSSDEEDSLNSSHGERTSTAWVATKQHSVLRQAVKDEMGVRDDADHRSSLDWHDHWHEEHHEEDADEDVALLPKIEKDTTGSTFRVKVYISYPGHYHGTAVFSDGDDQHMEASSERAATAVLTKSLGLTESKKCHVLVTNHHLRLKLSGCTKKGARLIELPLASVRCFSLHRDRHSKPKLVTVVALRSEAQRQQHPNKPYACYLVHFTRTADVASFKAVMSYVCKHFKD
eukprot:m.25895 g.25895  ORF g.25895 m.25895 type:complete len:251 (+) comp11640_c0_seq1:67-819(+)